MKPKKQIIGLPVYEPGKPIEEVKKEYNLTEVIKLASNENPFGASPAATEAVIQEAANLSVYPDGASMELREALADHYHIGADQLIFGAGSDEVCVLISRAFLVPGTNSVMATPTFPRYKANAIMDGAEAIEVPLTATGDHDLSKMKEQIDSKTRVVWLCSPNNPTGTYINEQDLLSFLDDVPRDILVVLDEAYYEYVTAGDYPDSLSVLDRYPNVIILRTFSKIYGLASLRIGYGVARAEIIDLLNRVREPFNTTRVAQAAALAALHDQDYVQECKQKNREGMQQLVDAFRELGFSHYPSQGNFVLVDVNRPANQVFEALLQEGIIVRSGESLGFPTQLRITVGSREQNKQIIDALSHLMQSVT